MLNSDAAYGEKILNLAYGVMRGVQDRMTFLAVTDIPESQLPAYLEKFDRPNRSVSESYGLAGKSTDVPGQVFDGHSGEAKSRYRVQEPRSPYRQYRSADEITSITPGETNGREVLYELIVRNSPCTYSKSTGLMDSLLKNAPYIEGQTIVSVFSRAGNPDDIERAIRTLVAHWDDTVSQMASSAPGRNPYYLTYTLAEAAVEVANAGGANIHIEGLQEKAQCERAHFAITAQVDFNNHIKKGTVAYDTRYPEVKSR